MLASLALATLLVVPVDDKRNDCSECVAIVTTTTDTYCVMDMMQESINHPVKVWVKGRTEPLVIDDQHILLNCPD